VDLQTKVDLLADTPLFSSFTRHELSTVAELFSEKSYSKGTTIFHEGDEGYTFCVVVSGELEVWAGKDNPRLLDRLGAGEVLGEMALLSGGRRSATVKVRFQDLDEKAHVIEAQGLTSVACQHEIDHLNGILFVDHLSPLKRSIFRKKWKKIQEHLTEQM